MMEIAELIVGLPAVALSIATLLATIAWIVMRITSQSSSWQGFVALLIWLLLSCPIPYLVVSAALGREATIGSIFIFVAIGLSLGAILRVLYFRLGTDEGKGSALRALASRAWSGDEGAYEAAVKRLNREKDA